MWSRRKNQQVPMSCGCGFSFKDQLVQNIRNHVKSCQFESNQMEKSKAQHKMKPGPLRCGFCGFLFSKEHNEGDFRKHLNTYHPKGAEKCFCESCYPLSSNLLSVGCQYSCKACDYQTGCSTKAKRHELIVHDMKCPYCRCQIEGVKLKKHIDKEHFMLKYFLSRLHIKTVDESLEVEDEYPTVSTELSDLTNESLALKMLSFSDEQ